MRMEEKYFPRELLNKTYGIRCHLIIKYCHLITEFSANVSWSRDCQKVSLVAQGMQETWVWFLGQEDFLEKEMATHSSILAWRIPCTEEPGRLWSMGSQRVKHDWETNTFTAWKIVIWFKSSGANCAYRKTVWPQSLTPSGTTHLCVAPHTHSTPLNHLYKWLFLSSILFCMFEIFYNSVKVMFSY